ncbi:MAG TPA: hypothetical protein VNZ03_27420 [Terriglobales bacterium]|jgi:hypothetical protein|nr:hypothetical protein [Terriglobales bacterium]
MRQFGIALVMAVGLVLVACGGGSSSNDTVTGNWTATLTGTQDLTFTTSLQSNGSSVTGTNLTFTTSTPCFTSGGSQTGSFILSGNLNGNVTGTFQLTITSGTPPGNTLVLQGTVNNNTITGTWTLTGLTSGCTGSGNFTLTKM